MKNFKDKVVIVTGASSGIGEAMAREFAAQGARVVLGARSVQKLQLIAGEIRSQGGQAAYCGVDVTNVDECRRLIETAVNEFGGIDVLVCNAGLSMRAIFDDVDLGVLHRLMDVNFWGTVNCCKFALPYLQQSHGSIVGISSVAACTAFRGGRLFGVEIRHDGFSRNPAHRESQKGPARHDRLPRLHGFERPFLGPHGRPGRRRAKPRATRPR